MGSTLLKAPQLVVWPVTVSAEDRTERAVLEPARVEFLECGIGDWILVRRPIAADVSGPIWSPRQREIETGGNLVAQAPVGAVDISRPDGGTNALLAEKCGTREQKDALARVLRLPVILHTEGVRKWKDVGEFGAVADGDLAAAEDGVAHVRPVFFGLGAVEPECIPSLRQQLARQVLPVEVARLGVGGVIDVRVGHKFVLCIEQLIGFGFADRAAPRQRSWRARSPCAARRDLALRRDSWN